MTRYSKSLGAFNDVKQIFDAALQHGIVEYELPSYSKAIAWRTRAYKFRNMLLANSEAALTNTRGIAPSTPYDTIFISVPPQSPTVIIRRERPAGKLTLPDGTPLEMGKASAPTPTNAALADPLLEEAERLAREADIEL